MMLHLLFSLSSYAQVHQKTSYNQLTSNTLHNILNVNTPACYLTVNNVSWNFSSLTPNDGIYRSTASLSVPGNVSTGSNQLDISTKGNNDKTITFQISTTGLRDINLSFNAYISTGWGTYGYKNITYQYSLDGSNYSTATAMISEISTSSQNYSINLPAGVNDQRNVYIRLNFSNKKQSSDVIPQHTYLSNLLFKGTYMDHFAITQSASENCGSGIILTSPATVNGYSWSSNPAGTISVDQQLSVNPSTATTYSLTATDCDGGTCTDDVTISVLSPGAITEGTSTICQGDDFLIESRTNASGTNEGISYYWTYQKNGGGEIIIDESNAPFISNSTVATVSNLEVGTYLFKRYAKASCPNPIASDNTHTLFIRSVNPGSLSGSALLAQGGNFALTETTVSEANGTSTPLTYKWKWTGSSSDSIETGSALLNINSISPALGAGNYLFTRYANIEGQCEMPSNGSFSLTIFQFNAGEIETGRDTICNESTFTILGTTPASGAENVIYQWYYSVNGGSETVIPSATTASLSSTQFSQTRSGGVYQFIRYASVANPISWARSNGSYQLVMIETHPGNIISSEESVCSNSIVYAIENSEQAYTTPAITSGLTYSWSYSKDGAQPITIANANGTTLTNSNFSQNIGGIYKFYRHVQYKTCIAKTAPGSALLTIVKISNGGNIARETQYVCDGDSFVIASASDPAFIPTSATITYTWKYRYNNGSNYTYMDSNSATLSSVLAESGDYTFYREFSVNGVCTRTSSSTKVYKLDPGSIDSTTKYLCNETENNVTITETVSPQYYGSGAVTYNWYEIVDTAYSLGNHSSYSANLTEAASKRYIRKVTVNGCTSTSSGIATVKKLLSAPIGANSICAINGNGQSFIIGQNAPIAHYGVGNPVRYQWKLNGITLSDAIEATFTASNLPAGLYQYQRNINDGCQVSYDDAWTVYVKNKGNIGRSSNRTYEDQVTIQAIDAPNYGSENGAFSYMWYVNGEATTCTDANYTGTLNRFGAFNFTRKEISNECESFSDGMVSIEKYDIGEELASNCRYVNNTLSSWDYNSGNSSNFDSFYSNGTGLQPSSVMYCNGSYGSSDLNSYVSCSDNRLAISTWYGDNATVVFQVSTKNMNNLKMNLEACYQSKSVWFVTYYGYRKLSYSYSTDGGNSFSGETTLNLSEGATPFSLGQISFPNIQNVDKVYIKLHLSDRTGNSSLVGSESYSYLDNVVFTADYINPFQITATPSHRELSNDNGQVAFTAFNTPSVIWKSNGSPVSTEPTYTTSQAGVYTASGPDNCTVGARVYHLTAGSVRATVQSICYGNSFKISSDAAPVLTPETPRNFTYQWRYTTNYNSEEIVLSVNTDTLNSNQLDHPLPGGIYYFKRYVHSNNTWLPSSNVFELRIVQPVTETAPILANNTLCEGGNALLNATTGILLNGTAFPEYQWQYSTDGIQWKNVKDSVSTTLHHTVTTTGEYQYKILYRYLSGACSSESVPAVVTVMADPVLQIPVLSNNSGCPTTMVTLTAPPPVGGTGSYAYAWQYSTNPNTGIWYPVGRQSEATYSATGGSSITAFNFVTNSGSDMVAFYYRVLVENQSGCNAASGDTAYHVINIPTPVTRGDTVVCPQDLILPHQATQPNGYALIWYGNFTDSDTIAHPSVHIQNEQKQIAYAASWDEHLNCTSAKIADTITVVYTSHIVYQSGGENQNICLHNAITPIVYRYSGEAVPMITWEGTANSNTPPTGINTKAGNGSFTISGTPHQTGDYRYSLSLNETQCSDPVIQRGSINVSSIYDITLYKTVCNGNVYTVSDTRGHAYTYTASGHYVAHLETTSGCDSIVRLILTVNSFNMLGYENNHSLIAGWSSFGSITNVLSADCGNELMSRAQISYQKADWSEGYNTNNGLKITTGANVINHSALCQLGGNSLALPNKDKTGYNLSSFNDKSIIIKTSTLNYDDIILHIDYRTTKAGEDINSDEDRSFRKIQFFVSTNGINYFEHSLTESLVDNAQGVINLPLSDHYPEIVNCENIYIKCIFSESKYSSFLGLNGVGTQYLLLDNLYFAGKKAIKQLSMNTGNEEIVCSNANIILEATTPYINNDLYPADTAIVNYTWLKKSTQHTEILAEHGNRLIDTTSQSVQYIVSVGAEGCMMSDTVNVTVRQPIYNHDIVLFQTICSGELDDENFLNNENAYISYPSIDSLRKGGIIICDLNYPNENGEGCDSIVRMQLTINRSFDTTIVVNLCEGDQYHQFGFNITPEHYQLGYNEYRNNGFCSNGCDSTVKLIVVVTSTQQLLTPENNVTLVAWDVNNKNNNFFPSCGVRTLNTQFFVSFENTNVWSGVSKADGRTSASTCLSTSGINNSIKLANGFSTCGEPWYSFDNTFIEFKIHPKDFQNLTLAFDYKRDNNNVFNKIQYQYKPAGGHYINLGEFPLTNADWQTLNIPLSSVPTLEQEEVYIKLIFTGGSKGDKQECGFLNRFDFYSSYYLYLDNFIFTADKPAQVTIGTHTVSHDYICEGEEIEFKAMASEGDFTFQLFNERNHEPHDFTGYTLSILPDSSTRYSIISTDINGCHTLQQLTVTVQQQPFIELLSGGRDTGVCRTFDIGNISYKLHNISSSSLTWDRAGTTVAPEGLTISSVGDEYTISGVPQFDGGRIYTIKGYSPHPNCQSTEIEGSIHTRAIPEIEILQGAENNCLGDSLSITLRNLDKMVFGSVEEEERVVWRISETDTVSRQSTHTIDSLSSLDQQRYYMDVKQEYCFFIDSIDVHIYEEVMPGYIDSRQKTICHGNTPPDITETLPATTENGPLLYRWWKRINNGDFEIISSANQSTYSPSDSETGTYTYQREVSDGCNRWQTSEGTFILRIIQPIVLENIKVANPIVCSGLKDTISVEVKYDRNGGTPQLKWEYSSDNLRWHQLDSDHHYRSYFTGDSNSTLVANLAFEDVLPAGYHNFRLVASQPEVSDCYDTIGTRILFSRNTENDILNCQDNLIAMLGYGQCDTTFYTLPAPKLFQFDSQETEDSTIVTMNHDANLPLTIPGEGHVVVSWTVSDRCGFTHTCQQEIEVVYPACGDDYRVTDIEGNEYQTVRIGCDCWMQENLKSTLYNDGSAVAVSTPYYSKIYSNTEENEQIFGRLYTWHSAVNISENSLDNPPTNAYGHVEGVCPRGWYLPTSDDFEKMTHLTANEQKSNQHWINNANGTAEEPIFNAKPGGLYDADGNKFFNLKGNAYFWTSTTQKRTTAVHCEYNYSCPDMIITEITKNTGLSLRCIKE